jgi:hypothetical protein
MAARPTAKRSAAAKKKAATKKKAMAPKVATVETSTIEAELAKSTVPLKRTQSDRRDMAMKVERAMEEKLGRYNKVAIETTIIEPGRRARDLFKEDIEAAGSVAHATTNKVRLVLDEIAGSLSALKPVDLTEEVSDALLLALDVAVHLDNKARSPEPLMLYLSHCARMSETDFLGLLLNLRYSKNLSQGHFIDIIYEVMKYIVRTDSSDHHRRVLEQAVPLFDIPLMRQYQKLKRVGVSVEQWIDSEFDLACLIMSKADILAVKTARGKWDQVAAQIRRLTEATRTGLAVFAFARDLIAKEAFLQSIGSLLKDVIDEDFAEDAVRKWSAACIEKDAVFQKKKVKSKTTDVLTLFQEPLQFENESVLATSQLKYALAMREKAIGRPGGLPMSALEELIFGHIAIPPGDCKIPQSVLKPALAARSVLKTVCDQNADASLIDLQAVVRSTSETLLRMDRSVRVDLELIYQSEDLIDKALGRKILLALASETNHLTISQSLVLLSELKASRLAKLARAAMQKAIDSTTEVLGDMLEGVAPSCGFTGGGDMYEQIWRVFPFYATTKVNDGAQEKTLYGHTAIKHMHADIKAKFDDDEIMDVKELENLELHSYALSKPDLDEFAQWTIKILAKMHGTTAPAGTEKKSVKPVGKLASSSSSSSANASRTRDTQRATILKLFGKA